MSTKIITDTELLDAIERVIERRGLDYVDPRSGDMSGCVYSSDKGVTGSCIIGSALIDELGITYDPRWEGRLVPALLMDVLPIYDVDTTGVSENVIKGAREIQADQDCGVPYETLKDHLDYIRHNLNEGEQQ